MATIQGVYVALFGRPADPLGLEFFNDATNEGADLTAIGDLAATAEYQDRFEGMSNTQIVNSIYQSLFGRDADLAGLTFFVTALNNGDLTINNVAIAILDGAQGTDKTRVDTKVAAADLYTASLDTGAEVVAYNGDAAIKSAVDWLKTVSTTVPTQAAVDTAVSNMVKASTGGGSGGDGAILTLTNSATGDVFTPTSTESASKTTDGNDTIRGLGVDVLNDADIIDGGEGTDTLTSKMDPDGGATASVRPVLKSVEIVNLTYGAIVNADVTFNASDTSGIQQLNISELDLTASSFAATGVENSTVVSLIDVTGAAAEAITVGFRSTSGSNDAATVSVQGTSANTNLTVAGIEKLTLNSKTAANDVDLTIANTKELVITGDKDLTLTHDAAGVLKTVDASAFTGVLTYTATGNGETITGGTKGDIITLGAGNDVVKYTSAAQSKLGSVDTISGFNADAADKIDLSAFDLGAGTTIGAAGFEPGADSAGFFTGTNKLMFSETNDLLYVDVNGDGNFNAAQDLVINLDGETLATVGTTTDLDISDFIL